MDRQRMTGWEKDALLRLAVAEQILCRETGAIEKRAKSAPGCWRDIRMLQAKIEKIQKQLLDTVPLEQLYILQRAMKDCSYEIGSRGPAGRNAAKFKEENGMWLPYQVINVLFGGAREKCLVCMNSMEDQKRCPLRKALDLIPSDVEDRADGGCPYMDVTL